MFLMQFGLTGRREGGRGGFKAFYDVLQEHARGKLVERSEEEVRFYLQTLLGGGGTVTAAAAATAGAAAAAAAAAGTCYMEGDVLRRVSLLGLIEQKVLEYQTREPDNFFIDDGKQTGWSKACSITTKTFKLNWGRAQDLMLLELTLRHGYGNWRSFLKDPTFVASFPPSALTVAGQQQQQRPLSASPVGGGGGDGFGKEGNGAPTAAAALAVAAAEAGAAAAVSGSAGKAHRRKGYTDGQEKQLLSIIQKRMKLMSQALVIEKQRLQRKIRAITHIQSRVSHLVAQETNAGEVFPPPILAPLLEQRQQLQLKVRELFEELRREARLETSIQVVELGKRLEGHNARVLNLLRRNQELLVALNSTRLQMMMGPLVTERLARQTQELEKVNREIREGIQATTECFQEIERVVEGAYSEVVAPAPVAAPVVEQQQQVLLVTPVEQQQQQQQQQVQQQQAQQQAQQQQQEQQQQQQQQQTTSAVAVEGTAALPPLNAASSSASAGNPGGNGHGQIGGTGAAAAAPKEDGGMEVVDLCDSDDEEVGGEKSNANSDVTDGGNGVP